MSVRDEHLDLAAGYALGCLDAADRARFESLLASESGAELERELASFQNAAALLACAAPAAMPSPALRPRVIAAVSGSGAARVTTPAAVAAGRGRILEIPSQRRSGWLTWTFAAAAVLLAVTTATTWNTVRTLRAELARNQEQLAAQTRKLAEEQRWSDVLSAPGARAASLEMTTTGQAAMRARATFDPATRSAVLVFENVQVPNGQDLELWALQGAGVASLGLIKPDANGRAILRLENVGDPAGLAGFAVSLEPLGGSGNPAAPSGPVIMAGKFGG